MSRPTIETLARRYVEARDDVAALTSARRASRCDYEPTYGYVEHPEEPRRVRNHDAGCDCRPAQMDGPCHEPCWKRRTPMVTINHEGDTKGGDLAPVEDWCPSCRERQAIHVQIRPAQRRMAARLSALVSATRARG